MHLRLCAVFFEIDILLIIQKNFSFYRVQIICKEI
jgi:hypothetical protein